LFGHFGQCNGRIALGTGAAVDKEYSHFFFAITISRPLI
jgi:hypothetical protein